MPCVFELHTHTSEVSACGHVPAKQVVHELHDAGYDGCVITDHMNFHTQEIILGVKSVTPELRTPENWKKILPAYRRGYDLAREEGERIGMTVLFGCEIRFPEYENDYLLFGDVFPFLEENPFISFENAEIGSEVAHRYGLLMVQAHPYRPNQVPIPSRLLDGMEIYNGNPRHIRHGQNDKAAIYARERNLIPTVGSDYHQLGDQGYTATLFADEIHNTDELVAALRARKYRMTIHPDLTLPLCGAF